jgi:hypothetical protein
MRRLAGQTKAPLNLFRSSECAAIAHKGIMHNMQLRNTDGSIANFYSKAWGRRLKIHM